MVDAINDPVHEDSSPSLDLHGTFDFQKDHPLFDTHHVVYRGPSNVFIPNFFGAVLPRHDHGDYEYYCCTMLTLFQPWHSGKDLKGPNMNWSEAFANFKFSSCQLEIMRHFNLRYECLDA
ncbi:uncharacterized protein EV420DRAFT_1287447 [Desarmillaria tabescens]|uniref:Uncharacterized protein n=1 Tax=Armillaria tabescens TaxID=1929756 RepID=A0AA39IUJ7_ARMTA|nr:uncharacterized protein EV420DRAFT_1287447 [Desarmillaria tabescens]KAK0430140.1 hypothetical protein EV420DRAFT_1287447 [Desarmillaria tabescens]